MNPEVRVMQPSGRLDVTNVNQFRREVADIAAFSPKFLLIDLKDITFMDSSGLGALVAALKTVRSSGGDLALCSPTDQVQMLFDLTSMGTIFKVYANVKEFTARTGVNVKI
ncbi:anti-anti-sigma factor [Synechococcus sp. PCC 7502]|uniref:STAS domain-containing protein n=1 Tax=Synechococcus sp. PCC 7502 TaxID=1173263 RepID=UPI00029FA173|nr:STAS domain-containing protein [Synechococcus sp. PCC 7502]AFY74584.1 anti-anti-sigma factor [Synechococcus sp. PCC 7502]